jgi:hypothetical protein
VDSISPAPAADVRLDLAGSARSARSTMCSGRRGTSGSTTLNIDTHQSKGRDDYLRDAFADDPLTPEDQEPKKQSDPVPSAPGLTC